MAWGLSLLCNEDATALCEGRVGTDAVQVAAQLLDGTDRSDPLDLDGDPAIFRVAAQVVAVMGQVGRCRRSMWPSGRRS